MQDWCDWLFCVKIFFPSTVPEFFLKKKSKKRKNPRSIHFACFNILSSFFLETKCKPIKNIHRDVLPVNWKHIQKFRELFREFSRLSPEKNIYVSLAPFHSIMLTLELSFVPSDHILFYWNCCLHFSFDSFKRMGTCRLITTTLMKRTLSSVFLWVWLQIFNQVICSLTESRRLLGWFLE